MSLVRTGGLRYEVLPTEVHLLGSSFLQASRGRQWERFALERTLLCINPASQALYLFSGLVIPSPFVEYTYPFQLPLTPAVKRRVVICGESGIPLFPIFLRRPYGHLRRSSDYKDTRFKSQYTTLLTVGLTDSLLATGQAAIAASAALPHHLLLGGEVQPPASARFLIHLLNIR